MDVIRGDETCVITSLGLLYVVVFMFDDLDFVLA